MKQDRGGERVAAAAAAARAAAAPPPAANYAEAAWDVTCSAVVWLASLSGLCQIKIVYNLNNLNKLAHAEW